MDEADMLFSIKYNIKINDYINSNHLSLLII
jgi:hypothetical protein